MTKKHFKAIAEVIKESTEDFDTVDMVKSALVGNLARYFASINDAFDSVRFRAACYGRGESDNA